MERKILKNKLFLYATEFFAGMSVMAVELGASRLLAPYFSSSQIVWTIIIATIMIAMALGNVWGGRMADKDPNPDKLYVRILIAAVWTAAIPFLGKYVIIGVSAVLALFVQSNFLVWASFVSCMIIFVFPLLLLGTVTPSLVKYTTENLTDNGKTVGTLGALNTIGSIIGTFTPTFVTIPSVGTSVTFLIFSGIMLAIALIYLIASRAKIKQCMIAIILYIVFCVAGHSGSFAFWEDQLVYEDESIYNYLQVKETDTSVILSTNVLFGVQSIMMKEGGLTGMYYDYAMAAPFLAGKEAEDEVNVLILGLGTGTYASQCTRYFPNSNIEGVEIDEKIADLSSEYFGLPDSVKVSVYDGRAYLDAADEIYDVIMVDAYQDITIPFQMSSVEFFTLVRDHLKEDGVMVVNMNMVSDKKGSINEYLSDTIASVFPSVATVKVKGGTNKELFASMNKDMLDNLETTRMQIADEQLYDMMRTVSKELEVYEKGTCILTDDKAPVEVLGMRVIDELISDELTYYRGIFDERGLKGLLDELM